MRQHTIIGERMLHVAPALGGVARLVRWSHERVDGGGYTDGLAGDEIPLGARIIAVCDAVGAMTSDRPYRSAMSADAAVAELLSNADTQFDPDVIAAFRAELAEPSRLCLALPPAAGLESRVLSASAS
jgi:HD-GYP domain-containing protein (c-di-GMP phosphodiesterase class II)